MEAQQVCVGDEVLPAVLYSAAFHSFSPLTLLDWGVCVCARVLGGCVSPFYLGWGAGKEGKKSMGTGLCWPVRNYLTTPSLTLDTLWFLPLHPAPHPTPHLPSLPTAPSHPSLLISTTLLCALPPLSSFFCCWGNAIWHG